MAGSFKLVSHLLAACFSVFLVVLHSRTHGVTQRIIGQDFARVFFPDDFRKYNGDATDNPQGRYFVFTRQELEDAVTGMLQRYWNATTTLLVPAAIAGPTSSVPLPAAVWTHLQASTAALTDPRASPSMDTRTDRISMSGPDAVWPFAGPGAVDMGRFYGTTASVTYDLRLRLWDPMPQDSAAKVRGCSDWSALFTYDFRGRGQFEVTWQYVQVGRCDVGNGDDGPPTAAVAAAMLSAIVHLACLIAGWAKDGYRFVRAMHAQESSAAPAVLSWWDGLALVGAWDVCATLGSSLILVHTAGLLANSLDMGLGIAGEALGIASSLLLLSLLSWVSFSPRFYSTVLTLHAALPKIALFLAGALPIFISFAMFALAVFGRHAVRYGNGVMSVMTLFAFINGDALTEIFQHTQGTSPPPSAYWAKLHMGGQPPWWNSPSLTRGGWSYGLSFYTVVGDLHLVLITFLFMYLVLNVIVGMVEEAFFLTRSRDSGRDMLDKVGGREARVRAAVDRLLA